MSKKLLSIIEIGGYPDFGKLYRSLGFEAQTVNSMRKGLKQIKKSPPDVVIAEFNYQTDFRDRTSSLESLMAALQPYPQTRVVVFYEKPQAEFFNKFCTRFDFVNALTFPVEEAELKRLLEEK